MASSLLVLVPKIVNSTIATLANYWSLDSLGTHRLEHASTTIVDGIVSTTIFPFENEIAALSIVFCRLTVSYYSETYSTRVFFAFVLGSLYYWVLPHCNNEERYKILTACEVVSHLLPFLTKTFYSTAKNQFNQNNNDNNDNTPNKDRHKATSFLTKFWNQKSVYFVGILPLILVVMWLFQLVNISSLFHQGLQYLLPISEFSNAYTMITRFTTNTNELKSQLYQLLFVTFHIQVGMGFIGIDFLRKEQLRRNQLVLIDQQSLTTNANDNLSTTKKDSNNKLQKARMFRKSTLPFIVFTVIPYMCQLILFGGLNMYAYSCFKDDLHRAVRLNVLFENDAHLVSISSSSTTKSPGVYATSMDNVVSTTYDIINRKLFSLPKLLLLPGIMMKQPMLFIRVFPLILAADKFKAMLVASMTTEIERLNKQRKDLQTRRTKIEGFDLKNADLIQRSGGYLASSITQYRWAKITKEIQSLEIRHGLLKRTRDYFQWLQSQFILKALVDGAIAMLIATDKLVSADIFVFARAMEDAVDFLLTRSRSDSELSEMKTNINILNELADLLEANNNNRKLLRCAIAPSTTTSSSERNYSSLLIPSLMYSRGTTTVRINNLELQPGIYALTGKNGSGKSSFFRIIQSCDTNRKSIHLPESITVINSEDETDSLAEDSIEITPFGDQQHNENAVKAPMLILPSADVVEISQNFYWPLHTKPIDWIYQELVSEMSEARRSDLVSRVEHELSLLQFKRDTVSDRINLSRDLLEEKDDWFNELSGGQKCKVELVRKVFLLKSCPAVLLIDETLAPLDPESKVLVMQRIKAFCSKSVVIVIYHNDVPDNAVDYLATEKNEERSFAEDISQTCVPSNNFFDDNLHVENGYLTKRSLCI